MTAILEYSRSRLRRFGQQLRHIPRIGAIVWDAAGHRSLIWASLFVIEGLLPIATVYLTRSLVNHLVTIVRTNGDWTAIRSTLMIAVWMAAVVIAAQILRSASIWIQTTQAELVKDYLAGLIHKKSLEVDLAFYDSADFYDHLHRARSEANYRPTVLINSIGSLVQNLITMLAMIVVLIPFGPILPVALLASALPVLYVVLKAAHRRHFWNQQTTIENRRSWYYDELLTRGESAAEMRLFDLGTYFRENYQSLRRQLRNERSKLARHEAGDEFWAGLTALAIASSALGWMIWRAVRGFVSLGDLALLYQALNQGLRMARSLLENLGQFYENALFLGNLFEFLDLKPQIQSPQKSGSVSFPSRATIEFENVSFQYPGSNRPALSNFSLKLVSGQTVALVGPNGAGKSTLIKLLCRFYDPDSGSIRINDTDLRKIPTEDLYRFLTVQFQNPIRYNASAQSNIRYGDLKHPDRDAKAAAQHAAQYAGADEFIRSLPEGYDSQLGRWFENGNELSVGQWQRMGLARSFFRIAPIIVLDEPTSSMDPWAEITWANQFRELAKDRIGIIITHRFTTAVFADIIYVIVDGQIVEAGTHTQLLEKKGQYAQVWAATAQ